MASRAMITVSADTRTLTWRMDKVGVDLIAAVSRGVLRAVIILQRYITRNKLSGNPLHSKTGRLAASIIYTEPTFDGRMVTGEVRTDSPYAIVHERGGTFNIREHLRTSVLGKSFSVKSHSATFPQRAFMLPALLEARPQIVGAISKAVKEGVS